MNARGIRRLFALIIVAVLAVNVFAATYVISDYSFAIDGKTQKRVVRDLIVPEGEEKFATEEELVAALESKKQALKNKRFFKSVEYDYTLSEEVDETIRADVRFVIRDAKTFLFVPYPNYDSNKGTTINAKVRDKNLMGTFATLEGDMYGLFKDGDWSNPKLNGEFNITNLLMGDTVFSIKMKANGYLKEKNPYYYLGTNVTNIPFFFNTYFNLNTYVEKSGEGNRVYLSSSYNGVKFLGIGITPSVTSEVYTKSPASNYVTPALSVSGIKLLSTTIGLSASVKLTPTAESEYLKYVPSTYNGSVSTSFGGKFLNGVSLTTTAEYKPKASITLKNNLNYALSDATTLHLSEDVYMDDKGDVSYYDTGVGFSQKMNIGKNVSITPKFIEYFKTTNLETDPETTRRYTFSASASANRINWIGNFREGYAYSISIDETWYLDGSVRNAGPVRENFSFTYFKLLWNWFNPNFRVLANYQINSSDYGYIFGRSGDAGEEVRGVLNDRIRDNNMFALVVNTNLVTLFPMPKLFDFADYYASVFFDYALVKENATAENEHYYGFGVEGVGIFKEYPSYPIRLSIGIDLERFKAWLKDDGPSNFYEIFFGLDFFF